MSRKNGRWSIVKCKSSYSLSWSYDGIFLGIFPLTPVQLFFPLRAFLILSVDPMMGGNLGQYIFCSHSWNPVDRLGTLWLLSMPDKQTNTCSLLHQHWTKYKQQMIPATFSPSKTLLFPNYEIRSIQQCPRPEWMSGQNEIFLYFHFQLKISGTGRGGPHIPLTKWCCI